jgi:hypothetical protein
MRFSGRGHRMTQRRKTRPGGPQARQLRQIRQLPSGRAGENLGGTCQGPTADGFPLRQSPGGGPGGLPRPIGAGHGGRPSIAGATRQRDMGATRHLLSNDINGLREQAGYGIGLVVRLNSYNLTQLNHLKTQPTVSARLAVEQSCAVLCAFLRFCAHFYGFVRIFTVLCAYLRFCAHILSATPALFPLGLGP